MNPSLHWKDQNPIPHTLAVNDESIYRDNQDFFLDHVNVGASERKPLHSRFLQSLLDRRPNDAHVSNHLKFLSPMVRYSKMPFRVLCRRYGADLAFTPMIVGKDVNRGGYITNIIDGYEVSDPNDYLYPSEYLDMFTSEPVDEEPTVLYKLKNPEDSLLALEEFTTSPEDRPLVAQLAINDPIDAGKCAELFDLYVDGFDINCGCPQTWVQQEGIGAVLSGKPELVQECLREIRKRSTGSLSIKIRLRDNLQETVELVRRAEMMGVDWITVHGRTKNEKTAADVRVGAIKLINDVVGCDVIYNGDLNKPSDISKAIESTNAAGVLLARGALANPAIFSDVANTPVECMLDYMNLVLKYGGLFAMHQHHLAYMQYGSVSKGDRSFFTSLKSLVGARDYYVSKGYQASLPEDYIHTPNIAHTYSPLYSASQSQRDLSHYPTPSHDISPFSRLPEDMCTPIPHKPIFGYEKDVTFDF